MRRAAASTNRWAAALTRSSHGVGWAAASASGPGHSMRGPSSSSSSSPSTSSLTTIRSSTRPYSTTAVVTGPPAETTNLNETEHAVISTFDLFSIGIGPSSSHTVGPMRAGIIFISDLSDLKLLHKVHTIKIWLYGSLALTGAGHMTPQALLGGLEGDDCETVDPDAVPVRFEDIKKSGKLHLGRNLARTLAKDRDASGAAAVVPTDGNIIDFDYEKDLKWMYGKKMPHHSNGLRLCVFDVEGEMLATNDYYSVGGGFVVNGALATADNIRGSNTPTSKDNIQLIEDIADVAAHPVDWGENIFYKSIRRKDAEDGRRSGSSATEGDADSILPPVQDGEGQLLEPESGNDPEVPSDLVETDQGSTKPNKPSSGPRYPFHNAASLLRQCKRNNLTIAQVVWENELTWHSPAAVREKLFKIWATMDACIRAGVESTETTLPGPLNVRRRAPNLYARLLRGSGLFRGGKSTLSTTTTDRPPTPNTTTLPPTSLAAAAASFPLTTRPRVIGAFNHPIPPSPPRKASFPAIEHLTCFAIATNEQNASGGRIVTAPTNGAAGVLPSVLKYSVDFIFDDDDDPARDLMNFLLTASAIGMLFKRGATLSAAEGGCMAEVGVATAMAAAGFVTVLGGSPEKILQASVIGIEHNLGLTCDPLNGQVQIPCIERNALGAVKAVTAAQLALAGDGKHAVTLDEAITAMRETARDMHTSYKETSLGGLATAVKIPVVVPDC